MKNNPKIIVITGAESTGKSKLTKQLAEYFNVPFVPEIARHYIEHLNRNYVYSDIEAIANKQIEMYNKFCDYDAQFIFMDTWLIVTKIWFEFVFQKKPGWLVPELLKHKIELFLVCDTDLPWIVDPVRENGGKNRDILQNLYIDNLDKYGFKYKIVSGLDKDRFINAKRFIEDF